MGVFLWNRGNKVKVKGVSVVLVYCEKQWVVQSKKTEFEVGYFHDTGRMP